MNFRTVSVKYYIYIQHLFNNKYVDVYSCQTQLKAAINFKYQLCKKNKEKMLCDSCNPLHYIPWVPNEICN